jgi:Tannase and feruloyl esterase
MYKIRPHISSALKIHRMLVPLAAVAVLIILIGARVWPAAQAQTAASISCETLASVSLPNTAITSAQKVAAGAFVPPGGRGGSAAAPWTELPEFCRIAATTKMLNSDVKFEVWLPARGWNGDVQPAGSSFWGGAIPFARMRTLVNGGAATVGTNLGIEGFAGPSFVLEHPEKLENLKMDPLHAAIGHAKTLATRFYGSGPRFSVMDECGGGGSRDVMAEVQRWPADLDAAVAVNFTNYGTRHGISQVWMHQATHRSPAHFIPSEKLPAIHAAALDACDLRDGVKDGVIEDPSRCNFDPGVLLCKGADNNKCLTAPQVDAARRIYETPRHARTKEPIYGHMSPGSELDWASMIGRDEPYPYAQSFYRYLVYRDPNWTYAARPANFDGDVDLAEAPQNLVMNHTNPDLSGFVSRGGKLLLVGGWNDNLPVQNVITYYERVVATVSADKVRNAVRLFVVPGMHHCFGETHPGSYKVDFDAVAAVRQWKTTGRAPEQIVVSTSGEGWPARRRLVCPYPQVSKYKGSGSTDDPANFTCRTP